MPFRVSPLVLVDQPRGVSPAADSEPPGERNSSVEKSAGSIASSDFAR